MPQEAIQRFEPQELKVILQVIIRIGRCMLSSRRMRLLVFFTLVRIGMLPDV